MSNFNEKGNLEITSIASGVQTDNVLIRNVTSDGDILVYVNDGGTDTLALTVDGASAEVSLAKELNLAAGLVVVGATSLTGNVTVVGDIGVTGGLTLSDNLDLNAKLDCQASISGGASPGHIVKSTLPTTETYTGTNAGLTIKQYDADNAVVHTEDELAGLYINLKQLSTIGGGGKSALISAHNYGSGGDYQALDFGLRLFGDIVDAIEVTGGTVTSAIKLDTCTALTNVLKLADGVGCAVGTTMVKDPETDQEAGFITIAVGGTSYQIPFYATA